MITLNEIVPGEIKEFIVEEACSLNDVTETIAKQYHGGLKGVLWNFSDSRVHHLDADDMKTIALVARQHATHRKTAFFSPHDLQFGMLRMYEAYAEMGEVPHQMMVFRDRSKAIEWLRE